MTPEPRKAETGETPDIKNMTDAGSRGQQGGAAWQTPETSAGPAPRPSREQLNERIMQHCVDACGETIAHCLANLEQGDESYAALLHAAVECQDSFCAHWSELTGPGGAWHAKAVEACASACESLATACQPFLPQDAQAQQCAEACHATSERLRHAGL